MDLSEFILIIGLSIRMSNYLFTNPNLNKVASLEIIEDQLKKNKPSTPDISTANQTDRKRNDTDNTRISMMKGMIL